MFRSWGKRVPLRSLLTVGAVAILVAACSTTEEPEATPSPAVDKCTNGKRNKGEDGVDCGGTCKAACDGVACGADGDCKSGICTANVCAPSASKKCGTGRPALCADSESCQNDDDCTSDYCGDETAQCSAPPPGVHSDGRRDATETDVDCGGTSGIACDAGKKCKVNDDCTSTCADGVCTAPNDTDGKKNNGETDVDCGGPSAKKCGLTKACAGNGDCGLGYCAADQKCAAPSSTDGVKNGTETDVDCGGPAFGFDGVTVPTNPTCGLAKACGVDADCQGSVCADNKRCVEAPSCRPLHGGYTCGVGEVGQPNAAHESCCKSLPVPGMTMTQNGVSKQVYLDKYEITAGRIRAWVEGIKGQYGGAPNIQAWVKARMAQDPILAPMFPGESSDFLPAVSNGQPKTFPALGGGTQSIDIGLDDQLGPTSYWREQVGGTHGCWNGVEGYGHRTYWATQAQALARGELFRGDAAKDVLDEKSVNCMTPVMFAAFCAWDGGYMMSTPILEAAYGTKKWPWGDLPEVNDAAAKIANYNLNTNFGSSVAPRYLFPVVGYGAFINDFSSIVAAPGRFPGDIASETRPNQESWMDLGGNMLEWSQANGAFWGWTGASFEGHNYNRQWASAINVWDKYGKGTSRCFRLK
jgi:hypothetical protein